MANSGSGRFGSDAVKKLESESLKLKSKSKLNIKPVLPSLWKLNFSFRLSLSNFLTASEPNRPDPLLAISTDMVI